jgi:hypothetical protein
MKTQFMERSELKLLSELIPTPRCYETYLNWVWGSIPTYNLCRDK